MCDPLSEGNIADVRLVTAEEISAARQLISTHVVRTPLLPPPNPESPLWIKPESLQPTGAFKVRGALYTLATLPDETRRRGVVAYSSGNHARAVAYAARMFDVPATVVVPHTAPAAKVDAARALGAEIVEVEVAEREARAERLATERGATLVPPFDSPTVIAGQGTVGWEIAEDGEVDVVLVPVSGGGLISGIGVAIKTLRPNASVIGVEPQLAADARDSIRAGERRSWPVDLRTSTAADGLTAEPSELTFAHMREVVDDIVTVSEDEIAGTVGFLAREYRVVAERSGAAAVAAYLHHRDELPRAGAGRTVAVVSGGNIDAADLAKLL